MIARKLKTGRDVDVCSVCNSLIRPPLLFCEHCGPPVPPPDKIPESIRFSQALFRIVVVVLLFGGAIYFKAGRDIQQDVGKVITQIKSQIPGIEEPSVQSTEPDYKLVHVVNVDMANIRSKPTTQSEVIGVAEKGEILKVLQKKQAWSQVQLKNQKGWIASRLLSARVE